MHAPPTYELSPRPKRRCPPGCLAYCPWTHTKRIGRDYPHGLADREVLTIAQRESRILITDDRDFGELVFRHRQRHTGIIYLRLASYSFALTTARLEEVLVNHASQLDRFLVVTPASVRERKS